MKDALVYRARTITPVVEREIDRLAGDLPDLTVFIVCYSPDCQSERDSTPGKIYHYGQRDLHTLPYPKKLADVNWADPTRWPQPDETRFSRELRMGHQDLPVLKFFLDHPQFDRYWIIEDDVRCSGPWSDIFTELARSPADLLMTVIQNYSEMPGWYWWNALITGSDVVPLEQRVKGFPPFCRLSEAFLRAVDHKYRNESWGGHYEVTWPTIARASGLSFEDVGGSGLYTPPERRGKFYSCSRSTWHLFPGTFIFRPPFHDMGSSRFGENMTPHTMLWHPVKV